MTDQNTQWFPFNPQPWGRTYTQESDTPYDDDVIGAILTYLGIDQVDIPAHWFTDYEFDYQVDYTPADSSGYRVTATRKPKGKFATVPGHVVTDEPSTNLPATLH